MSQDGTTVGNANRPPTDSLGDAVATRVPGWERVAPIARRLSLVRLAALAGAIGLLLSVLFVLYDVVDTVGDPVLFYPVVVVPFLAATAFARYVRVRAAIGAGGVLLVAGLAWYLQALGGFPDLVAIVAHNLELLTGRRVLAIRQADAWALAVAPAPVFVTWYLALRREYVGAALAGGGTLGYFVLTGDATTTLTLLGVASGAALVGFGDLDGREWSGGAADHVAVVLAIMVLTPLVITIVPGGAASPVTFLGSESTTMEENVIGSDSDLQIIGEVDQSPAVRFTVTSDEARYWRTGSFDRYTGDGWVRSGGESEYAPSELAEPPGESEPLLQEFDVESDLAALPAAWRPTEVSTSVTDRATVTENGDLGVDGTIEAGESYQVVSAVTDPSLEKLVEAGTDYPDEVVERYTQLPESTPGRVADRTERLIEGTDSPYEAAVVVEEWLRTNREYSLDVDRPDGNIADSFLFEMEAGYCTYYATTMVTMLRTQGVPARMAVGYNAGQQVEEDRFAVRGVNSHAWVEVYFPEIGWVAFEPTPPDPRQEAEQAAVDRARAEGSDAVDTAETEPSSSGPGEITLPEEELQTGVNDSDPTAGVDHPGRGLVTDRDLEAATEAPEFESQFDPEAALEASGVNGSTTDNGSADGGDGGVGRPALPPREQLALGGIALVGAVAGLRQSRVGRRFSRAVRVRYQRRHDPATDVERAHDRLLLLLERRYRPRRPEETMQQYVDDVNPGPRARRVAELRERARYGGDVSRAAADEAVSLVESIREDW